MGTIRPSLKANERDKQMMGGKTLLRKVVADCRNDYKAELSDEKVETGLKKRGFLYNKLQSCAKSK